ncbi:hypothetical protein BC827DRAFT_1158359 [Russula dissimulans]|nr:hypothetical protein BC827DRAFT_1158359 [Russula dissimulans]
MPKASSRSRSKKTVCAVCGCSFRPQGYSAHLRKCARVRENRAAEGSTASDSQLAGPGVSEHPELAGGSNCSTPSLTGTLPQANMTDDITVISDTGSEANSSHHSSHLPHGLDIIEIKDTGSEASGSGHSPSHSSTSLSGYMEAMSTHFNTDKDFTLALLLNRSNMDGTLANEFIDLFHRCITGGGRLTISSVADIEAAWERAWANTTGMDR